MSAEQIAELYCQNSPSGFHVMRLLEARLQHDANKARSAIDATG
jgi:hypothetical protein